MTGDPRPHIGILGVGVHLPPTVRGNDWWPPAVVARWAARNRALAAAVAAAPPPPHEGGRRVVAALIAASDDPFDGVRERRVLDPGLAAIDMEELAARAALARAGVTAADIDVVLVHSAVPEYLLSNAACALHKRLGLPTACFAAEAQASSYSFLAQLALAAPWIETGRARHALLVQSSAISRLLDPEDPLSARFGDAAGAVVIGPVGPGRGVHAASHRTDGSYPRMLIASQPGGRWYDGRSLLHMADPDGARLAFLDTLDQSRAVIGDAVAAAGWTRADVDVLAIHQGRPWLLPAVLEHTGLTGVRTVDKLATTGHVLGASLPLALDQALADGTLDDGDRVVLMAGGVGSICGAVALTWGRDAS